MKTAPEKDFEVYCDEANEINPYFKAKLDLLSEYISQPNKDGSFFVKLSEWKLNGEQAMKFICLSNVFGYSVEFWTANNNVIVNFSKQ